MTDKVYIVTDLGPGDGGKGGVVHAVAKTQRAHTIIKRGGAQGSHGVRTAAGDAFAFSQWGCGTFDGIPTHLSDQLIVSPVGLLNEAAALRNEAGIPNPFNLLTVDENALVATPYHGIASRLFELARAGSPRGTIGTGIGQAYRDYRRHPETSLFMRDLNRPHLRDRLVATRELVREYVQPVVDQARFLNNDAAMARHELDLLEDDGFLNYTLACFEDTARMTRIVAHDYLAEVIMPKPGVAVVETSHGILTDRVYGFAPHTSAIRTLPSVTRRILDDAGYTGRIVHLGVHRAYAIRHGAGPLPTSNQTDTNHLVPDSRNHDNRWQGTVRAGALDGVLMRYAINVCGGPTAFDGLAITWFDQIRANGEWLYCNSYENCNDGSVFTETGELRVPAPVQSATTRQYVSALAGVHPMTQRQQIDARRSMRTLYGICADTVHAMTGVPVRMISFGQTEQHKLMN